MKTQKELLIAALIEVTTSNIGSLTIYRALNIDDCIQKQQYLAKNPWQNRLALILDKINIVFLKLLLIIDICLNQVKDKTNNDMAILGGLALVIIIEDFYQFFLIVGRFLWTHLVNIKKIYSKSI